MTWILNPYDEFAVEQALRVKEKLGGSGEVIAVTFGRAGAQTALRGVLAIGADRADPPAPRRPRARLAGGRARARRGGRSRSERTWSWLGKQAVDDDAAQVGPMLAELLGLPCVTVVAAFAARRRQRATVEREIEGGREVVELTLPAVLTTDKGLNEPRYASLKGIMAAKKKPIEETPASLGAPDPRGGVDVAAVRRAAPAGSWARAPGAIAELVRCCAKRRRSSEERDERSGLHRAARRPACGRVSREALGEATRLAAALGGAVVGVCAGGVRSRSRPRSARRAPSACCSQAHARFARYDAAGYAAGGRGGGASRGSRRVVLFAGSSMGKDLAPRVAARLGVGLASDCTHLDAAGGELIATRPVFAGKAIQKRALPERARRC